jgi:CheY-like chemotaxis protein
VSHSHSVLVVDDNVEIRELLKLALIDAGYAVRSAENGVAALEVIGSDTFDVILIDVQMPVMDGVELVRLYRALPGHQAQLVIMTAGHNARVYAEQIGADAYLSKPFELDDVLAITAELSGRAASPARAATS